MVFNLVQFLSFSYEFLAPTTCFLAWFGFLMVSLNFWFPKCNFVPRLLTLDLDPTDHLDLNPASGSWQYHEFACSGSRLLFHLSCIVSPALWCFQATISFAVTFIFVLALFLAASSSPDGLHLPFKSAQKYSSFLLLIFAQQLTSSSWWAGVPVYRYIYTRTYFFFPSLLSCLYMVLSKICWKETKLLVPCEVWRTHHSLTIRNKYIWRPRRVGMKF